MGNAGSETVAVEQQNALIGENTEVEGEQIEEETTLAVLPETKAAIRKDGANRAVNDKNYTMAYGYDLVRQAGYNGWKDWEVVADQGRSFRRRVIICARGLYI